jgi:hypothetical protein
MNKQSTSRVQDHSNFVRQVTGYVVEAPKPSAVIPRQVHREE